MAKGNWEFLHRSEAYIFYYRRAIPQLHHSSFNNHDMQIKGCAISRHGKFNSMFML